MNREQAMKKALKAFKLAGMEPQTAEQKAAYKLGCQLLQRLEDEESARKPKFGGLIEGVVNILPRAKTSNMDRLRALKDRLSNTEVIPWEKFIHKNKMVTFRVIPHATVSNNNKRLWKAIYKIYEINEGWKTRIERDGWKFSYREKDLFWYDVVFRQTNGEKKIEFYVSTTETQAIKLKRKLENKIDVTFQEADAAAIQIPKENTIIQEVKYLKHDIFSLNTNTQDTRTPIASILNTIDELQFDGDMARLSICNEAMDRQRWIKNASWAHEKLNKGRIPQRAGAGGKMAVAASKNLFTGIINEVNDLLTDTFQAISNAFFKSEKKFDKKKVIEKSYSLEDEINSKRLTGSSSEKINLPVFKSHIRFAAHSQDKLTRETIAETGVLAFADIAENNELHGKRITLKARKNEVIDELNTLQLTKKTKLDPDVNLISTDEMAKLALQLPTNELQRKYQDELSVKKRAEVNIPSCFKHGGIDLGVSTLKDEEIAISMPLSNPDEFYRGYVFIGGQGAGKDTAIKNWVVEGCMNNGISFVIPEVICEEGERGMADGIRDALPPEKIIDLDMSDEEYKIPMDLTEVIAKLGRLGASRFGDEMIDFMDMGDLTRAKKYLRDAAKASGGSLFNIKKIIENEEFRLKQIERLLAEGNERLANELIQWGTNDDLGNKVEPVLSRLDDFFGNDTLYDIFAQSPLPELNFEKWMQEGKVIIVRIPNRKLGELATKILVHWVVLKTFMTRMLMSKEQKDNGCFIVFNEPEQFATEGLTKLMGRIGTEGRKERFGSLFAFHHWNKLPQTLQENLQGGGVQQFLFMNDHTKTFDLSKHRLEPTISLEDAYKLPPHHAIISVRADKELQNAFICHMKPPVKQQYDNSFLTKRHSRMYGRKWEDLQKGVV